jgi:hypothetical protein
VAAAAAARDALGGRGPARDARAQAEGHGGGDAPLPLHGAGRGPAPAGRAPRRARRHHPRSKAGAGAHRGADHLPRGGRGGRAGARPGEVSAGALLADGPGVTHAAPVHGATLEGPEGTPERAVQVRPGRRHEVLRAARLARTRVPLDDARGPAPEAPAGLSPGCGRSSACSPRRRRKTSGGASAGRC